MAWRQLSLWVDDDGLAYQWGLEEFGDPMGTTRAAWTLMAGRGQELEPHQALDRLLEEPWKDPPAVQGQLYGAGF